MSKPLILAYHRVSQGAPTDTLAVSASVLKRQIQVLKLLGYRFLTLAQAVNARGRIAVVTFDDGYRDNLLYGLPVLRALQVPATLFMTTGRAGQEQPFYWDYKNQLVFSAKDYALTVAELKELKAHGWEIGSHTVDHYELTKLSVKEIEYQLVTSKSFLDKELQQDTQSFCCPRGAYSENFLELMKMAGYTQAVITPPKKMHTGSTYTLKRVGIYAHDTMIRYVLKILLSNVRGVI